MFHPITRRGFLIGCSAAIASLVGSRLTSLAFSLPHQASTPRDILLVIFLRGGADGLSMVPPLADPDRRYYEMARPMLKIPLSGQHALLPLDQRFGLHPFAAPLYELYQDGHLAFVHAAGLTSNTRSHFDAQAYMELGTPDRKNSTTGWITRHLQTQRHTSDALIPVLATGGEQPTSLLGSYQAVAMTSPDDFSLVAHWDYEGDLRDGLRRLYQGTDQALDRLGQRTLDTIDIIETLHPGDYTPSHGAQYPDGEFGDNLQVIAQMIKMQLGLEVATVDLGGWDTHEQQAWHVEGYFAELLHELSQGLHAFYTDLDTGGDDNPVQRLTVVVMSEFGRRVRENAALGTDHGHGNVMMVLGGPVNGGRVYGDWPGLHTDQLYQRADLAITTDYRQVLSEILIRRLGNPHLDTIFPGLQDYTPLGILQGDDLPPILGDTHHLFLPWTVGG